MISSPDKIASLKKYDPLDYFVKIIKLMVLTWKFRWRRIWYRGSFDQDEIAILKIFGKLKGRRAVEIQDLDSGKQKQIIFYGWINLMFYFWGEYFRNLIKAIKKLFWNQSFFYPPKEKFDRKRPFTSEKRKFPMLKKLVNVYNPYKHWIKITNIENQFEETIRFLYFERKYLEKKLFKISKVGGRKKKIKEVKVSQKGNIDEGKKQDYIEYLLNKIVPKKPIEPYQRNIWAFFFMFFILWFIVLIFVLPDYYFPAVSVYSKAPILLEILTSQIPIIVFYIVIYLLFLKYEELILFTEDNYDFQLGLVEQDISPSFKMRCDLRLVSHNVGGFILAFLIGFLLLSIPMFLFTYLIRYKLDIGLTWSYLVNIFVYSDIFILWAINFGMGVVALYIIGALAYGQYHISLEFKFRFDRFHSPNIDEQFKKYVRTISFYIFTSLFLFLSSGLVYFLSRQINLLFVVAYLLFACIIIVTLFLISLIGWKRAIHNHKSAVLQEIQERRKNLITFLREQENSTQFKMHEFKDIAELKFLNDQYLEIYNLKEWPIDFRIIFSFVISILTFLPNIIQLTRTFQILHFPF